MKSELEALLRAFDAFDQAPEGPEATRLKAVYEALLEEAAQRSKFSVEILDKAVRRFRPRWVRANLPTGFPKNLGLR